eukprot:2216328-Prymnesium_polylepis.1
MAVECPTLKPGTQAIPPPLSGGPASAHTHARPQRRNRSNTRSSSSHRSRTQFVSKDSFPVDSRNQSGDGSALSTQPAAWWPRWRHAGALFHCRRAVPRRPARRSRPAR